MGRLLLAFWQSFSLAPAGGFLYMAARAARIWTDVKW